MEFAFNLEGLDDLQYKMEQMPEVVGEKAVAAGLRAGAKEVLEEAKRRVPVKTGKLRDSLKVKKSKKRKDGTLAYEVGTSAKDKVFGGDSWYGAVVEFGAPNRDLPGTHFLEISATSQAPDCVDAIVKAMDKAVDRVAKKSGIKWVDRAEAFDAALDDL